jgi:hypothetical protein
MTLRRPLLRIDRIDKVEITTPAEPVLERALIEHLRRAHLVAQENERRHNPFLPMRLQGEATERSTASHVLDLLSKGVSILSGLAVIAFVVLLWLGKTSIGSVQISTLLTVFGFTLVGGLVSVGGVKVFSLSASLRRAQARIERFDSVSGGCPFVGAVDDQATREYGLRDSYNVGDPRFCSGCRLIDLNGRTVCRVSPRRGK